MGGLSPDWLSRLAPAHAPPPPGWWPPAPGWWGLAVLVLAGIAALVYWWFRPSQRLRRVALGELKRLEAGGADEGRLARGLENLVRRYAVARFGREPVADLSGRRWIEFVVDHGARDWGGDTGLELLRVAYGAGDRQDATDRARWLNGARAFIRGRR